MKKNFVVVSLLIIIIALFSGCGFENKADIVAAEDALTIPKEILEAREKKETDAHALVEQVLEQLNAEIVRINSTRDAELARIDNLITTTTIRPQPNERATACCWAHNVRASLNDFDNANNWANTYGDVCPPAAAIDNNNGTWWNMNYVRPNNATYPDVKHTEIPAEERIDEGNHWLTVELDNVVPVMGITYMGRNGNTNSRITSYRIFVDENYLGHGPPPDSFVYQGTFADNQNTQTANWGIAHARKGKYVQVRVLASTNAGGTDGGIAELRVIVMSNDTGGLFDQLAEERSVIVATALQETEEATLASGDAFEDAVADELLIIDYERLLLCYNEGLRAAPTVVKNPIKQNKLNELMNGKFDSSGNLVSKGALQYLQDDPDRPPLNIRTEAQLNDFFNYQRAVDDITIRLGSVIASLK